MDNTYFKHIICISTYKSGEGSRWSGGKEHDRSSTREEGYNAIMQDVRAVRGKVD